MVQHYISTQLCIRLPTRLLIAWKTIAALHACLPHSSLADVDGELAPHVARRCVEADHQPAKAVALRKPAAKLSGGLQQREGTPPLGCRQGPAWTPHLCRSSSAAHGAGRAGRQLEPHPGRTFHTTCVQARASLGGVLPEL